MKQQHIFSLSTGMGLIAAMLKKSKLLMLLMVFLLSGLSLKAQNNCLTFPGPANTASTANASLSSTLLTGATTFTVEAWINVSAYSTAGAHGNSIVVQESSGLGSPFLLRCGVNAGVNTLQFLAVVGATTYTAAGSVATLIPVNTWHHVAGVVNGSTVAVYVDGVLLNSVAAVGSFTPTNTGVAIRIGNDFGYTDRPFLGKIDEVRIWNTAVSVPTLLSWYNQPIQGCHPNYANLLGYYKMDDASNASVLKATLGADGTVTTATYGLANNSTYINNCNALNSITTTVNASTTNNQILRIGVVGTNATQFVLRTDGTTNVADITNAQLWYTGTSATFATTTPFGSAIATPPIAGTDMIFDGNQALTACSINYFWLTYDLPAGATNANVVDAILQSATLDGTNYVPAVTNPTGSRSILGNCAAPLNQPTGLFFNVATSAYPVSGFFTASTGLPAADNYLIIRSTSSTLSASPVDVTTYTAGTSLGGGTVVAYQSGLTFTDNGPLLPLTQYYYFIFAANSNCVGGPIYLTTTPLIGFTTTLGNVTYGSTTTWVCPTGVTSATIECWGSGGGGGSSNNTTTNGGSGGGGGAYSKSTLTTIPGNTYYLSVGAIGTGGVTTTVPSAGGSTWFNSANIAPTTTDGVLAKGGGAGANNSLTAPTNGGAIATGYGTIKFAGGNGAAGTASGGGGGGSSAGTGANGANGSGTTGGVAPTGGGSGGAGSTSANGTAGSVPGGGGGGSDDVATRVGGAGALGKIIITVLPYQPLLTAGTLTGFGSICANTISTATNSFTISGVLLNTADVTVGPLNGFIFSTTSGGTYTTSLALTQAGGTYSQAIYVKFNPTAGGSFNGNIPVGGGGAATINVIATGTGMITPPSITTQPGNQTVASGAGVGTFTVVATSATGYLWQESTNGGVAWNNITNGGVYGGATTASLTITNPPITMTTYQYRCIITGCALPDANTNGSATLTVNYCTNTGTTATYYINNFSTTGGITNITNNGSGYSTSGYGNFTSMSASAMPSTTINFSIACNSGTEGFGIWIDWNHDGDFADAGEQLYSSGGYYLSVTGSFTVPVSALTGNTRMRVVSNYLSTTPTACTGSTYTECEDYTFNVIPPPPPTITSLGSIAGCVGTTLTINGTNFAGATAAGVTIGGTPVTSIVSNSGTVMVVTIGTGTTGTVSVTALGGTVVSSQTFTVNPLPVISGMGCLFVSSNLTLTGDPTGGSWTSGTPAIATIDVASGYVNALSNGSSVITYTAPTTGCISTVSAVVYPAGTATVAPLSQIVCNTGTASPIVISGLGTGTVTLVNSTLASAPANTAVIGGTGTPTPVYTGGVLALYTNLTSQVAEMIINNPNSINSGEFTASVDVNVYPTGGADGLSFNFGSGIPLTSADLTTANATGLESGVGTGLSVCLKSYTTNTISVKYNGIQIGTSVAATINTAQNTYKTLAVSVNASNQITVTYGGIAIYTNLQLPVATYGTANKSSWIFAIASRSGGVAEGCNIKNLSITFPSLWEYSFNGGSSYQASPSYAPPSTTATYNVYFRPIGSNCPTSAGSSIVTAFTDPTAITGSSLVTQTQCINGAFSPITVTATGSNLTYQWYKNTIASTTGGTSLLAANGAQTDTYTPQASINGIFYYYCIVHGTCGIDQTSPISEAFTVNPVSQPTLLVLTPDYTSVSGSFTRSAGADTYLVVRSTSPTFGATLPLNGTTYISGNLIGTNTVVALTTDSTFIDAGLNQGTQYFYYIFAANSTCAAGISYLTINPLTNYTVTLSSNPCVTPINLPTALVFTTGVTTIGGSFTGTTPNSDYYLVVRSTSPTLIAGPIDQTTYAINDPLGGGVVVAYQIGSIFSFTDIGLIAGTHYYYHVYSVHTFCLGGPLYSASALNNDTYTNCIAPLAQPTLLTFPVTSLTSIDGSFTASATADHYLIVRNTTGTAPTSPVNATSYTPGVSTLGAGNLVIAYQTGTTFSDIGLTAATHYYYYIYAANSICSNGPVFLTTAPLTANTYTNCPAPIAQPTALVLTSTGNSQIAGSFTAASPAPDHYLILRSTASTPSVLPVNGTLYVANDVIGNCVVVANQTTTTFTNTGLAAGTTYYYFVYSANTSNCSIPAYMTTLPLTGNSVTGTYQNVPIANCNFDVVMNGNYIGTNPLSSNADCDDAGYALVSSDYAAGTGIICTATGGMYWPTTVSSSLNSGLTYVLKPSTVNNAFQVASSASGTLNLANQVTANTVYVMFSHAIGSQTTLPSVIVNFSDLTSQTFTNSVAIYNWCVTNPYQCFSTPLYRAGRANATCAVGSCSYFSQMSLAISPANQNKLITSITFNNAAGKLSVFAVGIAAMPLPTCWTPIAVTSAPLAYTAHVSWTAPTPAPADGYEYEIRTSGNAGSGATGLFTTGTTTSTFVDLVGLTPVSTYRVYVRSYCGPTDGYSTWSNLYTFTTTPSCLPPTGLGANLVTATSAHIYWNEALIVPSEGYEWEIRTSGAPGSGSTGLTDNGATLALYEDVTSLAAVTTYSLYVRSYCGAIDGWSTWTSAYVFTTTPSCFTPTTLTVSTITSTTATISWTAPAILPSIGYEWEVRTSGAAGSGATGLAQIGSNSLTSANLVGLSAMTTYYVYIRSDCDAGTYSTWSSAVSFITPCSEVSIFPWTESFDAMSTIGNSIVPDCWKVESGSGTPWASANAASNTYNDPFSNPNYITCNAVPSATNKYLITPVMHLTAGNYYDIGFKYVGDNVAGWTADVRYNTAPTGTGSTILGTEFLSATTAQPSNYSVVDRNFFPTTTGNYYFIVHLNNTASPYYLGLDDFMVTETQILPPTISSLSSLSGCVGTTLTITGTDLYPATAVSIGGTPVTVISNTLTSITVAVGTSTTGTVSVTTTAGTAISADTYTINQLPVNPGNPTSNSPQCSIPGVTLTESTTPPAGETWYWHLGATDTDILNSGSTFIVNTTGTYYLRAQNNATLCWSTGSGSAAVIVNTAPAITSQPGNQSVSPTTTATFTTAATGFGLTYQWQEYITSWNNISNGGVYTGATATSLIITNPPLSMDGHKYRCVVSGSCTPSPATTNGNAILTVQLVYCNSIPSYTADEEIYSVAFNGVSTPAAYANANGCSTVAPGPGSILNEYSNFTSLGALTSFNPGATVAFTISENECDGASYYSNGCAIWIDFNQNGVFTDAGEQVFVEGAVTLGPRTITGSFVVPATATPGNTRMRIIVAESTSGASLTPCMSYSWGETEDWTINIALPPPPTITSLGSTSGCAGSNLTINGTNLGSATAATITIGGTPVTSIVSNTGSVMVVKVGTGTTGTVSVTTLSGTAVSTQTFTVNPLPVLSASSNCLLAGTDITLTATPSGGTWTSGAPSIATIDVNSGLVHAITSGSTLITYTVPVTGCISTLTQNVATGTVAPTAQVACDNVTGVPIVISGAVAQTTTWLNSPLTSLPANIGVIGTNVTWPGSYLQLHQNTTGQYGEFYVNNPGVNNNAFTVTFDMNMYPVGGADGASFNYAGDIPTTLSALQSFSATGTTGGNGGTEEGVTNTGLVLQMQTYGPELLLKYNGVAISSSLPINVLSADGVFKTITISVNYSNQISVTIDGVAIYTNVALPAAYATANKSTWKMALAARSGGLNEGCRLRNFSIYSYADREYSFDGGVTYSSSNTFTPPMGANTTYNVYLRAVGASCATFLGGSTISSYYCQPCVNVISPVNSATNVAQSAILNWDVSQGAIGYKVYFGTDNPPTNIANGVDVGNTFIYDPSPDMNSTTTYYWRIAPYNANAAAAGCPIWSFTTACGLPNAPTTVSITPNTTNGTIANFSWTNPTASQTSSYYWAVGTGSNVTYDANYIDRGITTGLTASTSLLTCESNYYLAVKTYESCNTLFSNSTVSSQFTTSECVPTVTNLSPSSGCIGGTVVITGTSFLGATSVKINGTPVSSYIVDNYSTIHAVVGANTFGTGTIEVVTPSGTTTSTSTFTKTDPYINPPILSGSTGLCIGSTTNLTFNVGNPNGPFTLTYLPSGGVNTVVSGLNNGSTITVAPTVTTSYQVISVSDANGCKHDGNLVVNPSAFDGMNGWDIILNGGSGWLASQTYPGFVTSSSADIKSQTIDLLGKGYSSAELDASPRLDLSEDYRGILGSVSTDYYGLLTQFRNSGGTSLTNYSLPSGYINAGSPVYIQTLGTWQTTSTTLSAPTGLRSVYWENAGYDYNAYAGNAGSIMKGSTLKLSPVVTLHALPAPPTATSPQTFCASGAHAVANLTATGSGIKWYSAPTGGTLYLGTDVLVSGQYYASQTTNGCESPTRIDVTAVVNTTPTPTGSTLQGFIYVSTIADLVVSGTNINWYTAATGGTLLPTSTILVDGNTYYASQTLNACESGVRIAVTVSITLIKTVNLHFFLEGLYNPSTHMMNEAQDGNTGLPYFGYGIADRIQIDLFEENAPFAPIGVSISGIDLSPAGMASFQLSPTHSGNYFIKISSRNHLATWSAIAIPFNTTVVNYDFTTGAFQAYGSNPQIQVSASPDVFAFLLGDLDQGGWVDATDFNIFEPELTLGSTGFIISDFDGGGWVDAVDFNLFEPRITAGNASEYPGKK